MKFTRKTMNNQKLRSYMMKVLAFNVYKTEFSIDSWYY